MSGALLLPNEYWLSLQITPQDVENLHTFLFERETPLAMCDLCAEFIEARIKAERVAAEKKQKSGGKSFLPKETYQVGDELVFPALDWRRGKVEALRAGFNPAVKSFDVLSVVMEDDNSLHSFAANLESHFLNEAPIPEPEIDEMNPASILNEHGALIEKKLEAAFALDDDLVKIAGRWFPRALLIDIGQGQLNLAEAVLDMSGGEPLATEALIKDIELPAGINPKLAEFSVNYALQFDERFDEVGPAGQVLWCLHRLEPDLVRETPLPLRYIEIEHDRNDLNEAMLNLESQLDDELTPSSENDSHEEITSITIIVFTGWRQFIIQLRFEIQHCFIEVIPIMFDDELTPSSENDSHEEITSITIPLIYPHLRAGTLPMSTRARKWG
jgi:hypothetical protein